MEKILSEYVISMADFTNKDVKVKENHISYFSKKAGKLMSLS